MGDHRASIKIEMEFHGVKDKCDMWINYSPDTSDIADVDYRIIEFVRSVYRRGMSEWNASQIEYRLAEEEKLERATLKRLKDKYEN